LYVACAKFSVTIPLTNDATWYKKLKEAIEKTQVEVMWMSETKVWSCYVLRHELHLALLWKEI